MTWETGLLPLWNRYRWALGFFSMFALLAFVYQPSLRAPFYLDSINHIIVHSDAHMTEINAKSLWRATHASVGGTGLYRPLSYLTLAFTYYFVKLDPYWYRIGNIAIHCLGSLSVFFFLSSLLKVERVRKHHPALADNALAVAFLATALWTLHPIQTNVVIYVIQRMASLAGVFMFLCAGAFVRLRTSRGKQALLWGLACLAALGLSLASKENSVTILPLLGMLELLFFSRFDHPLYRKTLFWSVLAVSSAATLYIAFRGEVFYRMLEPIWSIRDFGPMERLLTQIRLQFWYLFILIVPDPRALNFDAEVTVSRGLLAPPETLAALLALLGLIGLAFVWWRKRPLLTFGILWYLVAQVVESTILPLELFFEHRMYVPSISIFLLLALGIHALHQRVPMPRKNLATVLIAVGMLFIAVGTQSRSIVWADPYAFYLDSAEKSPGKIRTSVSLSSELIQQGYFDEAENILQKAALVGGDTLPLAKLNLGVIAAKRGDLEKAEQYFKDAIEADDGAQSFQVLHRLASLKFNQGKYEEAKKYAEDCLRIDISRVAIWNLLGMTHYMLGNDEKAIAALKKAASMDDSFADPVAHLGEIYLKRQNFNLAVQAFDIAEKRNPSIMVVYAKQREEAKKGLASSGKKPSPQEKVPASAK